MKCQSCGAIGSPGKSKCDFCGASIDGGSVGNTLNTVAAPQVSFINDTLNLVGEINSTPSSGFNLWAFFFPVAYLWGYGAQDNAKKVAATTLIPILIISIVGYLSLNLANALNVLATVWVFFISYLVSTRTHALVVKGGNYNTGAGILAQVIFIVLYYIILSL